MTEREAFEQWYCDWWIASYPETPRWCVREWLLLDEDENYTDKTIVAQYAAWMASRQVAHVEAEKAHAAERLELHLLRGRFEAQQRLTNSALEALADKQALMDELDKRDARSSNALQPKARAGQCPCDICVRVRSSIAPQEASHARD